MGAADFWDHPDKAQKVVADMKLLKAQIGPLTDAQAEFDDAVVGYELAKEAGDKDMLAEADETLYQLLGKMHRIEQQSLLSGKHDHRNAFFTISAGDGGTEANDWAEMLFRMYLVLRPPPRVEDRGTLDAARMEVGLDSVTLPSGPFAYGYLSCERGTHRLARQPLQRAGQRQTSLRPSTSRPVRGGQTRHPRRRPRDHLLRPLLRPGRAERQQGRLRMPRGAPAHRADGRVEHLPRPAAEQEPGDVDPHVETEEIERDAARKRSTRPRAARSTAAGAQIRSYVIYDNRVKDHRTGHEIGNPQTVLDGHLDDFIDAELRAPQEQSEAARAAG